MTGAKSVRPPPRDGVADQRGVARRVPTAIARMSGSVILPSARSSPRFLPIAASIARIVEHVVHQLERRAEVHPVAREASSRVGCGIAQHGPESRRGLEQLRGLALDHAEIASLRRASASPEFISCSTSPSAITLVAFDRMSSTRIDRRRPSAGTRANRGSRRRAPTPALPNVALAVAMPAPQLRFVDDVVVKQRRRVDHLDDRRERVVIASRVAASARGQTAASAGAAACRRRR